MKANGYVAGRDLATVVFLALKMGRPLFLEGEAGVGKTEIAKVLAEGLGRKLIRLQCYEGLDINSAVYEWNYAAQMIEIRLAEASGELDRKRMGQDIFAERFLIKRALLQALEAPEGPRRFCSSMRSTGLMRPSRPISWKLLSDFQVTIPELGTIKAAEPPIVVITSNRTREVHDALKRRCLYHWVGYPDAERELEIVKAKRPEASASLAREVVAFVQACAVVTCSRRRELPKRWTGCRRSTNLTV